MHESVISVKSTAELIDVVTRNKDHKLCLVIQTDVPDLVVECLDLINRQDQRDSELAWNEKFTFKEGLKYLVTSVRSDGEIIPIFLKKHPVGILPGPDFVKVVVDGLYCKVDGLASALIKQAKEGLV